MNRTEASKLKVEGPKEDSVGAKIQGQGQVRARSGRTPEKSEKNRKRGEPGDLIFTMQISRKRRAEVHQKTVACGPKMTCRGFKRTRFPRKDLTFVVDFAMEAPTSA